MDPVELEVLSALIDDEALRAALRPAHLRGLSRPAGQAAAALLAVDGAGPRYVQASQRLLAAGAREALAALEQACGVFPTRPASDLAAWVRARARPTKAATRISRPASITRRTPKRSASRPPTSMSSTRIQTFPPPFL